MPKKLQSHAKKQALADLQAANAARFAAAAAAKNQSLAASLAASSSSVAGPVNQAPPAVPAVPVVLPAVVSAPVAGVVNQASNTVPAVPVVPSAVSPKPVAAKKDKEIEYVAAAIHCKSCANLGFDCLYQVCGRPPFLAGDLTRNRRVVEKARLASGDMRLRLVAFRCEYGDRSFYAADRYSVIMSHLSYASYTRSTNQEEANTWYGHRSFCTGFR